MTSILTPSTILTTLTDSQRNSLVMIATLVLMVLLIMKELANSADGTRSRRLDQAVNIAIVPLLVIFFMVVFVRIADILR